jgi:uncharacterized lipoprotein YmbA
MSITAKFARSSRAGLFTLLLYGCGTSPLPDYYLLTPNAQPASGASSDLIIGVGPIEVSDFLERPQIAIHSGTNRLEVDELNRWAEPIDRAVIRVMALNLAALLGTEKITGFPWRRDDRPDLAIRIAILALDHRQGQAILGVSWVLVDIESEQPVHQELKRYQQPSSNEPGLLAAAYSDLLAELAADIVNRIRTNASATANVQSPVPASDDSG